MPETAKMPNVQNYNWDLYSRIDYAYDITKPAGTRLTRLKYNGQDVTDNQVFRIAINNYRASGGGGYSMFREGKVLWTSADGVRDYIARSPRRRPRARRRHQLQMRQLGPSAGSVSAPGGWIGRGCCARGSQWTSSAARGAEEGGGCWRTSPRAASSGAFFATCTCPSSPHPRHLPGGQRSRRCGSDARLRDTLSRGAQGDRSPAQGRGMPGARRAGLLGALLHRPMRVARPSWTTTYPGPRPQQGSHAAYALSGTCTCPQRRRTRPSVCWTRRAPSFLETCWRRAPRRRERQVGEERRRARNL